MKLVFAIVALLALAGARAGELGIVNATGTLLERMRIWNDAGLPQDLAKVRTSDGRIFVADLGAPGGEATLQEGDRVVISGRALPIGDEVLVVAPLISETPGPGDREIRSEDGAFAVLDDDRDGKVSRAEAADLPVVRARFDALDRDGDGFLGREELAPAVRAALSSR